MMVAANDIKVLRNEIRSVIWFIDLFTKRSIKPQSKNKHPAVVKDKYSNCSGKWKDHVI